MTPKQVLERARSLVDAGWTQNALGVEYDAAGFKPVRFCALTAVWQALRADDETMTSASENITSRADWLRTQLAKQIPYHGVRLLMAVSGYNDTPGRTKAEMLALFDRTIAAVPPHWPSEI